MARKPEPPKPKSWTIYEVAVRSTWLVGTVEAVDKADAIARAVVEFKVIASKLIAVRRR